MPLTPHVTEGHGAFFTAPTQGPRTERRDGGHRGHSVGSLSTTAGVASAPNEGAPLIRGGLRQTETLQFVGDTAPVPPCQAPPTDAYANLQALTAASVSLLSELLGQRITSARQTRRTLAGCLLLPDSQVTVPPLLL